jgi:hypothetical protein
MGRKRTRPGKFIYLCLASLIFFAFFGCATLENTRIKIKGTIEAYQSLHRGKELLAKGDYEGASNENLKILSFALHRPPEDEAIYNLGFILAHPQNPKNDYRKSLIFFKKLAEDFPKSPWSERAKIWVGLFQENQKLNQTIEKLNHTIEKLNKVIEESKQVDIEIEERKREKGK